MKISELVEDAHSRSRRKGWYDGEAANRNVPEMLALIHSEISEALEAYRNGQMHTFWAETDGSYGPKKPDGLPIELADAVIRIADLCGYLGIDLEEAIRVKGAFNETRPLKHGGKRC